MNVGALLSFRVAEGIERVAFRTSVHGDGQALGMWKKHRLVLLGSWDNL